MTAFRPLAHGTKRRFVDEVCKVRADRARRRLGDFVKVDVLGKLDVLRVDAQRLVSALQIRTVDDDAPVKAPGAQQRLVENLGAVGGSKNDDALARIEAVDLGKQLVQGLSRARRCRRTWSLWFCRWRQSRR